jgi:hypothetical protein
MKPPLWYSRLASVSAPGIDFTKSESETTQSKGLLNAAGHFPEITHSPRNL